MRKKTIGEQAYEQLADRYAARADTKPHNAYYDRPAVISLLPDVRGLKVLDAGCGPGIYAEWLVTKGAQVIGFDVTPRMIELARERVGNRAEFRVADLNQPLSFAASATFDVVLCPLVLDYILDWRAAFCEFYRVLKPGGLVVVSYAHPAAEFFIHWPHDNYFETELRELTFRGFGEPHVRVKTYRRSLSDSLNPIIQAGFMLDHILEPQPTADFKQVDPKIYEELMRRPAFLCVRARKMSS